MRRVLIIAAVAATLLSPLVASAQDRGGWRRSDAGAYLRYEAADRDRGGGWRGGRGRDDGRGRGDARGEAPGHGEGPGRGEGQGRERYASPYDARRGPDQRSAPPPYLAAPQRGPAGRSWRQGQYLPPTYRGSVLQNPGRYRLRTPPPGYDWVGVGSDIYLVQRGSGMVLDTIPGGY